MSKKETNERKNGRSLSLRLDDVGLSGKRKKDEGKIRCDVTATGFLFPLLRRENQQIQNDDNNSSTWKIYQIRNNNKKINIIPSVENIARIAALCLKGQLFGLWGFSIFFFKKK